MKSELYSHKIAAVYPDAATAEAATFRLHAAKLGNSRIVRLEPNSGDADLGVEPEIDETRNTLTKDAAKGGVAGTAAGAVVAGAVSVLAPTLFISAPVVGPLIVLGYGAMIGSTAGAIRGLKLRENMLAGLVKDALKDGYHVVVVHARTEEQQHRAETVINDTLVEEIAHT